MRKWQPQISFRILMSNNQSDPVGEEKATLEAELAKLNAVNPCKSDSPARIIEIAVDHMETLYQRIEKSEEKEASLEAELAKVKEELRLSGILYERMKSGLSGKNTALRAERDHWEEKSANFEDDACHMRWKLLQTEETLRTVAHWAKEEELAKVLAERDALKAALEKLHALAESRLGSATGINPGVIWEMSGDALKTKEKGE